MKKIALSLALLAAAPSFAALAPLNESIAEIQAILNNRTLRSSLKTSEAIQEIIRTEDGYLVITNNYQLQIDLKYLPADKPGPQKYELKFHEAVPLEEETEHAGSES